MKGTAGRLIHALAEHRKLPPQSGFDLQYDTDTEAKVPLWQLTIDGTNRPEGVRYQSLSPELIRRSIASLPIDPSRFAFVDYGSGKGRVLLIAAEFPFQSISGVEFARELHEIAGANIAKHPLAQRKPVRSVWKDAVDFMPPAGPLVLFFYNPFGPAVLSRVIDRICSSLDDADDVWVIYHNPEHAELFIQSGRFLPVPTKEPWAIFRSIQPACRLGA